MAHRALIHVMRGTAPAVEPGEVIPETYRDPFGDEHPVDFESLVASGAAERITAKTAKAAKTAKSADDAESEDQGAESDGGDADASGDDTGE